MKTSPKLPVEASKLEDRCKIISEDDVILYVANSKDSTKTAGTNKFSKLAESKNDAQK